MTRRAVRLLVAAAFVATLGITAPAHAQATRGSGRIWLGIGGGVQVADKGLSDAFEIPLYAEIERVTVAYPAASGALISASGGFRVWKGFTVGAGVTRASRRADGTVNARLPHPFFDNQFREVEGTTSTRRSETGVHLLLGWMVPLGDRFHLIVTAGPSVLSVEQTLVTAVQFLESYPYDTAEFTGATTTRGSRRASGFNAGADLAWMFSPRAGIGGQVQGTRARARLDLDGRRISLDAGGVQAAAGIRLIF